MNEKNNREQIIKRFGKGFLGAVPLIGPMISELIDVTIPNQRIDRLEILFTKLEKKLLDEQINIEERIDDNTKVHLLEDGLLSASRAYSQERIDYIASLLKNGIKEEDLNYSQKKKYLNILDELTDVEICILIYHDICEFGGNREQFFKTHKKALNRGNLSSPQKQEDIDIGHLYNSNIDHLVNLNLLRPLYQKPSEGMTPNFNLSTGKLESNGNKITQFGISFLESIDKHMSSIQVE